MPSPAERSASYPHPRQAGHEPDEGPRLVAPAPRRPAVLRKRARKPTPSPAAKLAEEATHNLSGLHHLMRGRTEASESLPPGTGSTAGSSATSAPVPAPRPNPSLSPIPAEPEDERMGSDPHQASHSQEDPVEKSAPASSWASSSMSQGQGSLGAAGGDLLALPGLGRNVHPQPAPETPSTPWSAPTWPTRKYVNGIEKLRPITSPISRQTYLTNPLEKKFQVMPVPDSPVSAGQGGMEWDREPTRREQTDTDVRMVNGDGP